MARIPVVFANGKVGRIQETTLGYLIQKYEVIAFLRSSGWVHPRTDPVRRTKQFMVRLGNRRDDFMFKRNEH
jgi:hypothetical protein